jgi:poly-gamma-glutamate synthesis protein (capsule biosynthesis protein)
MIGIFGKRRLSGCLLFFFMVFFISCGQREFRVIIQEEGDFPDEKIWLEEALGGSPEFEALGLRLDSDSNNHAPKKSAAEIRIEFFSSWDFEDRPNGILVSQTWLVPQDNALAGRRDTPLDRCLEGKESLVTIDGLFPPFVALRVDGYAAGDDGYPLIRLVQMRIGFDKNKKSRAKKAAALEELLFELSKPLVSEKPVLTWISCAGDMMLGRNAGNILLDDGPAALLGDTAEIILQSDLAIVNLEGALSSRGKPAQKTFTFRFEPPSALASAVKNAGIDAVLLANNHAFDFGEEAFLDTMNYLEEAGIAFLGAGRNEEEASNPFIFEKNGFSANIWGLASFSGEISGWDGLGHAAGPDKAGYLHAGKNGAEKLKACLRDHAGKESLNIVLFHGGAEWSHKPDAATRELYPRLSSEGADLIIGSHPHIVQGFEWVEDKLIFWSLGNFVFSGMDDMDGADEGLLIRLGYRGKKPLYIEPFAIKLSGPKTELTPDQNLENFYRKSIELAGE